MPKYLDGAGLSHFWESIKPKLGGVVQSGTGTVISSDDAANLPPLSLTIHGKSVQDGTPSPSNPVPIRSVESANLLQNNGFSHVLNGVTFTVHDDGTISVSGTATANAFVDLGRGVLTLPAGKYTTSGAVGVGCSTYMYSNSPVAQLRSGFGTFELSGDTPVFYRFGVAKGATADYTLYPQIERGSAATAYQPYQSIKAAITGKNLLNPSRFSLDQANGPTPTVGADGRITISGTVTGAYQYVLLRGALMPVEHIPSYSGTLTNLRLRVYDVTAGMDLWRSDNANLQGPFTPTEGHDIRVYLQQISVNTATSFDGYVQLEYGSTATEYEPYTDASTYIPLNGHALRSLPDGTEDTLVIDSEGNKTLTQRIGLTTTATTDGITATIGTDAMSTTGDLSDGATVIYKLATPQTISLGKIDLPSLPSPSFSMHVDAAVTPTLDAEWWTQGGGKVVEAVSTRIAALEDDVAELQAQVPEREVLYDTSTWTILRYGRTVMVQVHGATATPSTSTALVTGILADYKPAYNCSATVLTSSGSSTQAARMAVYADTGNVYIVPAGYSSSASWYGTLTYIY